MSVAIGGTLGGRRACAPIDPRPPIRRGQRCRGLSSAGAGNGVRVIVEIVSTAGVPLRPLLLARRPACRARVIRDAPWPRAYAFVRAAPRIAFRATARRALARP